MNTLDIVMIVLTAAPILFGLILGSTRGVKRSIGRLLVVAGCVVAAYYLKDLLAGKILEISIGGTTVQDIIISKLTELGLNDVGDTAVIISKLIVTILLFVVMFLLIQFLSLIIVTPIINLILGKVEKKNRGGGAFIGLIQGVLVALVLCVPVNGTIQNVAKIANLDLVKDSTSSSASAVIGKDVAYAEETSTEGGEGASTEGSEGTSTEGSTTEGTTTEGTTDSTDATTEDTTNALNSVITMFQDYSNSSAFGKIYNTVGQQVFDKYIATTTYGEGENVKTYTFSGQIAAIEKASNIASALQKFQKLENGTATAEETIQSVKEAFAELDKLESESKETIQNVLSAAVKAAGLADYVDTSKIKDFDEINFTNEGEIIEDLYEFSQKEDTTIEDVNEIVKTVADSDLILPLMDATDMKVEDLTLVQKVEAKVYIDTLEDVSDDKKAILYKIFGLESSSSTPSGESTETPSGESTETPSGESTETPSGESTESGTTEGSGTASGETTGE